MRQRVTLARRLVFCLSTISAYNYMEDMKMPTEMREKMALKYEGKTFAKENEIVVGCQVSGSERPKVYCSACDWDECPDRDRRSFPVEVP